MGVERWRLVARKRRLSRAHRAAISRGLRRFHRQERAAARRRAIAARKGWITRRTRGPLAALELKGELAPAAELVSRKRETWEVTVAYTAKDGTVVDVTVRLVGYPGAHYEAAQIRAAAWYVHKHSPAALTGFELHGMDWRNTYRRGGGQEYHYPSGGVSLEEAFENAGGLFNTVGMAGLRVALVDDDEGEL